jgi:hypothetical protein
MINGIKDRYDVTTPEGAGHLAGLVAIIATTAGIGGGESAGCDAEEAASDAGNATESLVSKATDPRVGTPLEGVKDATRVSSNTDPYHNFPSAYDNLSQFGEMKTDVPSKYGPTTQIKLPWCYREHWGTFEWAINDVNELYHRFFRIIK